VAGFVGPNELRHVGDLFGKPGVAHRKQGCGSGDYAGQSAGVSPTVRISTTSVRIQPSLT
jgi:hypothetical protein